MQQVCLVLSGDLLDGVACLVDCALDSVLCTLSCLPGSPPGPHSPEQKQEQPRASSVSLFRFSCASSQGCMCSKV